MKKIPIFVAVGLAVASSLSAETVPSLVVGHYYGVDTYPVSLDDFNRIEIGDDHYTLKANNSNVKDQTLSYSQYPRFWVEDVERNNIVTSEKQIEESVIESPISYYASTQSLQTASEEPLTIIIYNLEGKHLLSSSISAERPLSVASLPTGVYIATPNGASTSLKFVKN